MKSLFTLAMLATGCQEPSAEIIGLSEAQNLQLRMELFSNFLDVRLFYDFAGDSNDCQLLGGTFHATLAGTPMTVDAGQFREDLDTYECTIPEVSTHMLPSPFRGSLVLADQSRTITCEVGGRVIESEFRAHFDCGGVENSVFVHSGAPPIE